MLRHRHLISFFITLLFYLTMAVLFWYVENISVGTEEKPREKIISFSLASYEEKPIMKKIIEPEPIEEPIHPAPQTSEEEPSIEELKPETVLAAPIVKKVLPKPRRVVKKKKTIVKKKRYLKKKIKKRIVKKNILKKRTKHTLKGEATKATKAQVNPAKKSIFLAKVRRRINQAKSYPRIAQRRGMQGSVKVRFTILPNGQVSHIETKGKKVFLKSAREAVKKAFPISVKNCPLSLPSKVNFTLRYQLK